MCVSGVKRELYINNEYILQRVTYFDLHWQQDVYSLESGGWVGDWRFYQGVRC